MVVLRTLTQKRVAIKEFWAETSELGNSFFRANMIIFGLEGLFGLVVLGVIYLRRGSFSLNMLKAHWGILLIGALIAIAVFTAIMAVLVGIWVFVAVIIGLKMSLFIEAFPTIIECAVLKL